MVIISETRIKKLTPANKLININSSEKSDNSDTFKTFVGTKPGIFLVKLILDEKIYHSKIKI
jgi:hypothetical protein